MNAMNAELLKDFISTLPTNDKTQVKVRVNIGGAHFTFAIIDAVFEDGQIVFLTNPITVEKA